ncbi:MAG TPA: hypothetical protein VF449_00275 [Parvibaculum sp.]
MLLLAAPLALGGCGFRPLYGDHGAASVVNQLSGVDVAAPESPIGRELKFDLLDRFSESGDAPASAPYKIVLSPTDYTQNVAVQQNAAITRANYVLVVPFRLVETAHDKTVFHSTSRSRSSYNRVESEFANLAAAQDAEKRTAEAVADDIKLQLSVYFDRQASQAAPAQ